MKKTISVKVVSNERMYFPIYRVMCVDRDCVESVYGDFLSYELAKKTKRYIDDILSNIYPCSFITESLVWC